MPTKRQTGLKPTIEFDMAVWWQERTDRVNWAIEIVAAQTGCARSEVLALLRRRAQLTDTDLDQVSIGVIAGRIRFGDLDRPSSECRRPARAIPATSPTRHAAGSAAPCRTGSRQLSR